MATSVVSAIARRLKGKVAVITGGTSGIGKSTVGLFACHGARMIIADVQNDKGLALCAAHGIDVAAFVHYDITKESDVEHTVDAAVSRFGKLDIMFNNAGVVESLSSGFLHFEDAAAEFARVMGVNVLGAFLGTKHAAWVMAAAERGSIVTMASTALVMWGLAPPVYTFSKHAVVGLTRSTAAELGRFGVRVNCMSPHLLAMGISTVAMNTSCEEVEKVAEASANLKGVMLKAKDAAEAVTRLGLQCPSRVGWLGVIMVAAALLPLSAGLPPLSRVGPATASSVAATISCSFSMGWVRRYRMHESYGAASPFLPLPFSLESLVVQPADDIR